MKRFLLIAALILLVAAAGFAYFMLRPAQVSAPVVSLPTNTLSESEVFTDTEFGFSFEHASAIPVVATGKNDVNEFPGGRLVKEIQVGEPGEIVIYEVESSGMTITDEPDQHASPIGQTKYFYDRATQSWMVTYPEGRDNGGSGATTTATVFAHTQSGLPIFQSGRRFLTRIVPLSPTKFIVVSSNGGASTDAIAETISAR